VATVSWVTSTTGVPFDRAFSTFTHHAGGMKSSGTAGSSGPTKWTSRGKSGRGYSKASTDGCRNSQSPARGRTGKTGQPCWAASLRYARLTRRNLCPFPATLRSWWFRASRPCRHPPGRSRSPLQPPRSPTGPSLHPRSWPLALRKRWQLLLTGANGQPAVAGYLWNEQSTVQTGNHHRAYLPSRPDRRNHRIPLAQALPTLRPPRGANRRCWRRD
jgi:hypothetical protein